jgi:phenazine biosynthesis-like protein
MFVVHGLKVLSFLMPSRTYEFVQVDVFTQTPLAGNLLAIFPDGRGLDEVQMQGLAREMNLSETTFVLPRDAATEAREGKKVRIFTVEQDCRLPDIQPSAQRCTYMPPGRIHRSLLN